jgi:hypothetical protein
LFFNETFWGFKNAVEPKQKNLFFDIFKLITGVDRMLKIFDYYYVKQNDIEQHKKVTSRISVGICFLFKSDTPPPSYSSVLEYIKNLKSSPSPEKGFDFPKVARNAWDWMINVE